MRSQLLFLFLLFISMYTFGQTGSLKPRPVTEYFNYKTLDQVFDTLINKFDFKITYDQAEVNKSRFSYSFNNTFPDNVMKICLRETALKFVIEPDGTYKVYNPLKENMDQTTMKPNIAAKRKNIAIKGIVTVSYTHLDVYKRQIYLFGGTI